MVLKDRRKEYSLEYAGLWIRSLAALIDMLVLIAGIYILYCVLSQSFFWIFPDLPALLSTWRNFIYGMPLPGDVICLLAILLIAFLGGNIVYCITSWVSGGQTLGKLSIGIRVIRTDSSPVDTKTAFVRFFASLLCFLPLGAGFIAIAFNNRKQGWHDRIADTYVVKVPVKQVVYNKSLAGGGLR